MRGLASGAKGYEKYPKIFRNSFVFLNVYCRSAADEHEPRGPQGPYQFKDRSVPVIVIKRWNGETLLQQLGFFPDPKVARPRLEPIIRRALKEHGPIASPKAIRPLQRNFDRAATQLENDRPGAAYELLVKVVNAGGNKKKFADGPPLICQEASKKLEEILERGEARITEAAALEDSGAAKKALVRLKRIYREVPKLAEKLETALAGLP